MGLPVTVLGDPSRDGLQKWIEGNLMGLPLLLAVTTKLYVPELLNFPDTNGFYVLRLYALI